MREAKAEAARAVLKQAGRRVGQGDRQLLAPDKGREHRSRDRALLLGGGGARKKDSEGFGRRRVRQGAERAVQRVRGRAHKSTERVWCTVWKTRTPKTSTLIRDMVFDPVDDYARCGSPET